MRTPLERAILAEMSSAAMSSAAMSPEGTDARRLESPGSGAVSGAPDGAWSGSDSDLLSSTDGLHAVLLDDSAATRGWAARPGRRRRAD